MDGRKIILLVGALVIAAMTAFMARNLLMGAPAPVADAANMPAAAVDGPQVLVATRALPVGTILDPNAMKFQPWPKELVEGAYFVRGDTDPAKLQGTVVRFAIPAGQPITQGAVVKPGDRGFLAAALAPGMRAVTVPVSAQSSVAGFVFPGDRVDLVLTQEVAGGGDGPPLRVSETVLRNLRVLATDQRTDKQSDEEGKTVVSTYSTVTLEATPTIAEKISVAQTIGTLSLSLRSLADTPRDLDEAIASGEASVGDSDDPEAEKRMLAGIAGPQRGTSFSTGADVSRFQRSTVPGKAESSAPKSASMPTMMLPNGQMILPNGGGAPSGAPDGPVVRVARGTTVTAVPVGGKN